MQWGEGPPVSTSADHPNILPYALIAANGDLWRICVIDERTILVRNNRASRARH